MIDRRHDGLAHSTMLALAAALLSACGSGSASNIEPDPDAALARDVDPAADAHRRKLIFGGERPATLRVPRAYDPKRAYPLVVVLHGYSANGFYQSTYLGYRAFARQRDFFLIAPDGVKNTIGERYWNASPACCWFGLGPEVDDVTYLSNLIDEIADSYNIDPRRVYVVGHSNGGFMAYRLACERSEKIAAVVVLAGAAAQKPACTPKQPVSVLHVHGDADDLARYDGGGVGVMSYPGAAESARIWATFNGCAPRAIVDRARSPFDLDAIAAGAETTVSRYSGCPAGVDVELWSLAGVGHLPVFLYPTQFAELTFRWLEQHARTSSGVLRR